MRRSGTLGLLLATSIAASLGAAACGGSDDDPKPAGSGGAITGTGGAAPGTGAAVGTSGGTPGAGSGGAAATGGAMGVPAGQLSCGGKLCKAGGVCAADHTCPAFLGACFPPVGGPQTCSGYCESIGATCRQKGCYPDGTPSDQGYTWVSFEASECPASSVPSLVSFDGCSTGIGVTKPLPAGEVLRCCCAG